MEVQQLLGFKEAPVNRRGLGRWHTPGSAASRGVQVAPVSRGEPRARCVLQEHSSPTCASCRSR